MKIVVLFLFALTLSGQSILEDFQCQVPALVSPGTVTTVTCPSPHGYEAMPSTANTQVPNVLGQTYIIGSRTYRLVENLTGCSDGDVVRADATTLGVTTTQAQFISAQRLSAAINGSVRYWDGIGGAAVWTDRADTICAGTTAHADAFSGQYGQYLHVQSKVGGVAGELTIGGTGAAWKYADTTTSNATGKLSRNWKVQVAGATGSWVGIMGTTGKVARYKSPTEFEILFNSGSYGSWAGQSWTVVRTDLQSAASPMVRESTEHPAVSVPLNGSLDLQFAGCSDTETALNCGRAFQDPDNQKGYGDYGYINLNSLVVSGGIATAELTAAWPSTPNLAYDVMKPGARFFVRGLQKYYLQRPVSATADNGSGNVRVTATGHNCVAGDLAYLAGIAGTTEANGVWTPTIIDANRIDIPTAFVNTFAGGGFVTCNPHGRAPQAAAANGTRDVLGGVSTAYKAISYDAGAKTVTWATSLVDGTYTLTCTSPVAACIKPTPFLAMTRWSYPYLYISPKGTNSGSQWLYPTDMLAWHLKSGGFDPTLNRARVWIRWPASVPLNPTGSPQVNLGTYVQGTAADTTFFRSHYYHFLHNPIYNNRWILYEFNDAPSHQVGGDGNVAWPVNPLGSPGQGHLPYWAGGEERCYFCGSNITYFDAAYRMFTGTDGPSGGPAGFSYGTVSLGSIAMRTVTGEPEAWVRSRTATWAPARFGTATGALDVAQGYEVTWETLPLTPAPTFEVRYSAAGSIKVGGWSTATSGGTIVATGFTGYVWQSPTMGEADDIWVAIRPTMTLLGASASGQANWLIPRDETGLQVGDSITVAGVGGGRDGSKTVTGIVPRAVWFMGKPPGTVANRTTAWIDSGGEAGAGVVASGGTCSVALTVPHEMVPGWVIEVNGTTNTTLSSGTSWGTTKTYVVASTPTASSFTFSCPGVADGTYATSAASNKANISRFPGIGFAGTASASYTSGGTVTSAEEYTGFSEIELPVYGSQTSGVAPNAPGSLAATVLGSTSVQLDWLDLSDVETSFEVSRSLDGLSYAKVKTVAANTTSSVETGLTADTTYWYMVRAVNSYGSSANAGPVTATTEAAALPDVNGLVTVEAVRFNTSILVTGTQSTPGYKTSCTAQAFEGTTEAATMTLATGPSERKFGLTGLDPDISYAVRVICGSDAGETTVYATAALTGTASYKVRFSGAATVEYDCTLASNAWTCASNVSGTGSATIPVQARTLDFYRICLSSGNCGTPIPYVP